jgi:hypothetical protein
LNEFNGMKRVELQLLDWRVAKLSPEQPHSAPARTTPISQPQ